MLFLQYLIGCPKYIRMFDWIELLLRVFKTWRGQLIQTLVEGLGEGLYQLYQARLSQRINLGKCATLVLKTA